MKRSLPDFPQRWTQSCHHYKRICPTESEVHRTSNIKCCRTVQPHAKALDKEWKLHVVYLKQAKYFESLFSERWHIKNERLIELEIPDSNIDTHSLDTVFGSLYCDNVQVKPQRAVNVRQFYIPCVLSILSQVLAAASLLQHHALINHVSQVMISCINIKYVNRYYEASITYGLPELEKYCLEWYQYNFMLNKKNHRMQSDSNFKYIQIYDASRLYYFISNKSYCHIFVIRTPVKRHRC